eukprot:scaffold14175_cov40-Attheya_sp.AAC.1
MTTPTAAKPTHHHNTRGKRRQEAINRINQAIALRDQPPLQTPLMLNAVVDPITGANLEFPQLIKGPDSEEWWKSSANEFGRLAQGVMPHMPTGTNTFRFIKHTDMPNNRIATYVRIVCDERPVKSETKHVHLTVGGDKIDYPGK